MVSKLNTETTGQGGWAKDKIKGFKKIERLERGAFIFVFVCIFVFVFVHIQVYKFVFVCNVYCRLGAAIPV